MKKTVFLFAVLLTTALMGCKKLENLVGYLECNIDGGGKVKALQVLGSKIDSVLVVNGSGILGKTVTITMTHYGGVGTYTINPPETMVVFGTPGSPTDLFGADSGSTGSITITAVSGKYIDGEFFGTLVSQGGGSKTLTNGRFRFISPL